MADSDKAGLRQLMPSLFNGIATAIAAVAGLIGVLHETGYIGPRASQDAGVEERAAVQSQAPSQVGQVAAVDAHSAPSGSLASADDRAAAEPRRHRNLSGAWRDMGSNCHLIKQSGHELTVSSYYADNGGLWAVGSGTVKGRTVSVRINSANPASLEADLLLSDDGRELSGMIKGTKGAHLAKWRFVGPSCS